MLANASGFYAVPFAATAGVVNNPRGQISG